MEDAETPKLAYGLMATPYNDVLTRKDIIENSDNQKGNSRASILVNMRFRQ